MTVSNMFHDALRRIRIEVTVETDAAVPTHVQTTSQKHARDTERTKTLNLAKAHGESVGWRLQAPCYCREGQNVRCEIRDAVPGVGRHGLGIKGPAASELGNCHAQVREQANSSNSNARVVLVGRGEIGIVVVVMMAHDAVAMAVTVSMAVTMVMAILMARTCV